MQDELDRLRANNGLFQLLAQYAQLAEPERSVWQDRVMAMDGMEPTEISKLHGELIAFGWVEQNTGGSPGLRGGVVPACYRVTLAGIRAVQQIQTPEPIEMDKDAAPLAEEKTFVNKGRRKGAKSQERAFAASQS
jgi:hypothetical protein